MSDINSRSCAINEVGIVFQKVCILENELG